MIVRFKTLAIIFFTLMVFVAGCSQTADTAMNLNDFTLVMERGDGDPMIWPRSTYRFEKFVEFENEDFKTESLNIMVGKRGPMAGKIVGINLGDQHLHNVFRQSPMTSGRLFLFDSVDVNSQTPFTYIGKSGLVIEEFYDGVIGIKPEFYKWREQFE